MKSLVLAKRVAERTRTVTCSEAAKLSQARGAKVFWRPNGVVNYKQPELDPAEVAVAED